MKKYTFVYQADQADEALESVLDEAVHNVLTAMSQVEAGPDTGWTLDLIETVDSPDELVRGD